MRAATPPSGAPFAVPVDVDTWRVRALGLLQMALDEGDEATISLARDLLDLCKQEPPASLGLPLGLPLLLGRRGWRPPTNPVPPSSRPPQRLQ